MRDGRMMNPPADTKTKTLTKEGSRYGERYRVVYRGNKERESKKR